MKKIILVSIVLVILLSASLAYDRPLKLNNDPIDSFNTPDMFNDNFKQMVQQEMENFRRRFGSRGLGKMRNMSSLQSPLSSFSNNLSYGFSADSYVENGKFIVKCELPGMTEKEVKSYFSGDSLVIEGNKNSKFEKEDKDTNYSVSEVSYSKVSRMYSVPRNADRKNMKKEFKDGILTVTMDMK